MSISTNIEDSIIDWESIAESITQSTGRPFSIVGIETLSGGCINTAFRISDGRQYFFIKLNNLSKYAMFCAEAAGLAAISATNTLKTPQLICFGHNKNHSFILTEYLDFCGRLDEVQLGVQLAEMHQHTSHAFGWTQSNTIGTTVQLNPQTNNWQEFWRIYRLETQLALARKNGYGGILQILGEQLISRFPALFSTHFPTPSLLHGDLWSGNTAALAEDKPVVFDPAVYYGDREADIAMTELFGGFSTDFYAAYTDTWPLNAGYSVRKHLYNLYHVLNHLNLFGGYYEQNAIQLMQGLLAELR